MIVLNWLRRATRHVLAATRPALAALLLSLLVGAPAVATAAPGFPDHPIRLVIPFAPGGETDIFARVVSGKLGEVLGQPVVVENRPGATGIVACELVARSKPDGYTLIFGTAATHALNVSAFKKLPYDPLKDFQSVAFVGSVPLVLFANLSMPATLPAFINLLKAEPDKYSYGAPGVSTSYLSIELFMNAASLSAVYVPYRGSGLVLQDVLAGQVQFMSASIGVGLPMVQAGKLRAIAIMSAERLPAAPDLPTFAEGDLPGLEVGTWNVVMAPAGTPMPIVERLNKAINEVMSDPAIRERLNTLGIMPVADSTPESTADTIAKEIDKWARAFEISGAEKM